MCACEPGFTCSQCRGVTQHDDHKLEFELEPETARETEDRLAYRDELEQRGIQ